MNNPPISERNPTRKRQARSNEWRPTVSWRARSPTGRKGSGDWREFRALGFASIPVKDRPFEIAQPNLRKKMVR